MGVHLELLDKEWQQILKVLCVEFGFCASLPILPRLHVLQRSIWNKSWAAGVRQHIFAMHSEDFGIFGYSNDPTDVFPKSTEFVVLNITVSLSRWVCGWVLRL